MCRLYGFRANEETKVECTLVRAQNALLHQSRADARGRAHPDGWGIGYYRDGTPVRERRETAAFEDAHFSVAAERVFARTVVAHVRRATVGGPSIRNTHPFQCGRWLGAHNGTVRGFDQLESLLVGETDPDLQRHRQGTTDSEQAFLWLLARWRRAGIDLERPTIDVPHAIAVLSESLALLAERSQQADSSKPTQLNFLLTNGTVLFATRWNNSLAYVTRDGIRDCEICGIPHVHHHTGVQYRAVVVASEPISHEPWQEAPNPCVLAVDEQISLHRVPLAPTRPTTVETGR